MSKEPNESAPTFPRHPQQFYFARVDWLAFLREIKHLEESGADPLTDESLLEDSSAMLLATLLTLYELVTANQDSAITPLEFINKQISTAMLLDTCEIILFEIIPTESGYNIELTYKSMGGSTEKIPTIN